MIKLKKKDMTLFFETDPDNEEQAAKLSAALGKAIKAVRAASMQMKQHKDAKGLRVEAKSMNDRQMQELAAITKALLDLDKIDLDPTIGDRI